MHLKNTLLFVFSINILTIISCKIPTKKEFSLLEKTSFNKTIISELPAYEKLRDLITINMDTLIKFREAQLDHPEQVQSFTFFHDSENDFANKTINFENMPKFIFPALDSAFLAIKKGNIKGFTIYRDGTIDMPITKTYTEKINCDIYESFIWKKDMPKNLSLSAMAKDTSLTNECKYIIEIIKRGN